MIEPFVKFLRDDLNSFIANKVGTSNSEDDDDRFVICSNLNNITEDSSFSGSKIIISIVNIEEEKNA